ncbi:flagellar motor protein MotB, partial [Pseudomonas aeruginosa]
MFGKSAAPARARDEGEKPFWISFADLMTAMMILFLVVMVASLSSVTQR